MPRARLLILNGTLHGGGAEHVIHTLVRHLIGFDIDVSVAFLREGGVIRDQLEGDGFGVIDLSDSEHGAHGRSHPARLRQLVRQRKIQIVHSHDLSSLVAGSVARALSRNIRYVHTFHFGNYPHRPLKYRWLETVLTRFPDRLVAVGHRQADSISRTFGIGKSKIDVIWNGVDYLGQSHPSKLVQDLKSGGRIILGSMSTLSAQKDPMRLIDVAHELWQRRQDFSLVIVGDGSLRDELEAACRQRGLEECVVFLGWVNDASRSVLPLFDVFLQTSRWEAMSVVVLEAMAAGVPVVATRVGENERVLRNNESGLLVNMGDTKGMVDAVRQLLDDRDLRMHLSSQAHERYEEQFTGHAMAERYAALYRSLL